jgi:hypothetical protein
VAHSIEIWRTLLTTPGSTVQLDEPVPEAELPCGDDADTSVVELSRQYPGLPRALAEYLAR